MGNAQLPAPASPKAELNVTLSGLRSAKGVVQLCLTRRASGWLDCAHDNAAMKLATPASGPRQLNFGPLQPGTYALLVFHDENANGKLDTTMKIPREGFGFSNNPRIRMGAPRYDEVRFTVPAGSSMQSVRLRYLL